MKFDWKLDDDGDWQLSVDGNYFGLACPHCNRRTRPAAIWGGENVQCADTIDEAKQILINVARQFEYEDESDNGVYPDCC